MPKKNDTKRNTGEADKAVMPPSLPLIVIDRLRMETDGEGVTTLVAAKGCPLSCKYCINKKDDGTYEAELDEAWDEGSHYGGGTITVDIPKEWFDLPYDDFLGHVVTLAAEIPQGAGIDHARQAAQQEENQNLDIQLFMNETKLIHRAPPFP